MKTRELSMGENQAILKLRKEFTDILTTQVGQGKQQQFMTETLGAVKNK